MIVDLESELRKTSVANSALESSKVCIWWSDLCEVTCYNTSDSCMEMCLIRVAVF